MPAPKPAEIRAQVAELVRTGHSARAIEGLLAKRGVKVGRTVIAELAKQVRAGTLKAPAAKAAAVAPPAAPKAAAVSPPPTPGPAAPRPPTAPELAETPDPAEVADLDLRRLAEMAALVDDRMRTATLEGDVRLIETFLKTRERLSLLIAKVRPVIPPDPAKDPANTAARDDFRARLERAVDSSLGSDAGLDQLRAHVRRCEEAAALRRVEPSEESP